MRARRLTSVAAACAAVAIGAAGCSSGRPGGVGREGKPVTVAGLSYHVVITRELKLRDSEDRGDYSGPQAPPRVALFGVFVKGCNGKPRFRSPLPQVTLEG